MALENLSPVVREERLLAGENLEPETRLEYFLKQAGSGGETDRDRVFVDAFGAAGDGSTDDTEAIQSAIDYATENGYSLSFSKKTYKVTDTLTIDGGINVYGAGAFINATLDNKPVIVIDTTDAEIRNKVFMMLNIRNYGTGNVIEIGGTHSYISNFILECSLYAASGWCLKVSEYFSHCMVMLCTFNGNGIYAECGDANIFNKNMFFGENTTGIYLNTPSYGELNNAIINNTIVNAGYAIQIDSGDQTWICNNQMEYNGANDSIKNPAAMVYISGDTRSVKHCVIENNNFGGGTHLNYDLYIKCGEENIIRGNRFVAVNTADIQVMNGGATGSSRNYYYDDNIPVTQTSNPRTDTYQRVKISAVLPKCIIGCWHDVEINDSTRTIRVKKIDDGTVIMAPTTIVKSTVGQPQTVIFTLPYGYRPALNIYVTAWWTGTGTAAEVPLKIGYNGEVSFLEPTTYNSCEIYIPPIVVASY